MEGKRLIHSIRLRNVLSFGPDGMAIDLQPLNVLIGANASGKSNLLECISLLKETSADIDSYIRRGGGINEWIWRGEQPGRSAEVEVVVQSPQESGNLRYRISLVAIGLQEDVAEESVESDSLVGDDGKPIAFCKRRGTDADLMVQVPNADRRAPGREIKREWLNQGQSVLSQRKALNYYPEITYLGDVFSRIRLFRWWILGPNAPTRMPQPANLSGKFLSEDASNLALVLNELQGNRHVREELHRRVKDVYHYIEHIHPKTAEGSVLTYLDEGLRGETPATRLSDGTMRYLCLLVILCHPSPPPLICIEEPELGFHPDVLSDLGELLIEASQRTQLIITTHSAELISALSDVPESVIVCDRLGDGTHMERLEKDKLDYWLEKYSLGDVWRIGEIGGNP